MIKPYYETSLGRLYHGSCEEGESWENIIKDLKEYYR